MKKKVTIIVVIAVALIAVLTGGIIACSYLKGNGNKNVNENSIFNFEELSAYQPVVEDAGYNYGNNENIKGIYFKGANYNGEQTNVFAYIGVPTTEKPANGYPAMVLVHGGLGKAYPDWVKLWTDRGYVAISLSIDGNITDSTGNGVENNPQGGPKISITTADLANPENSWIYVSVANVIGCHNILRSMPEVDKSNVGITGISWGSYLTCITIGVDNRFKFAIPVYGAGFQHEDYTSGLASVFAFDDDNMEIYKTRFDPSVYMKYCNIPTLWLCGANDFAFSLYCNQRSADLSKGNKRFSWRANLVHGQQPGDGSGLPEIFAFADYIVKGEDSTLLRVNEGTLEDGIITVTAQNEVGIQNAKLFYSEYPSEYWHDPGNTWYSEDATVDGGTITVEVPENAVFAFIQITDANGNFVSSRLFAL